MTEKIYQGEDFDEKVRSQVEFYFSDSNLQTDRFLWKIYESNDGWVELKTILTFGRMRQYRPEDKVIEALKSSSKIKLSENNEMISRTDPVKDFNELKNLRKRNTVHIEGLPKHLTQEDLETFFSDKIAPLLPEEKGINSVRRIRNRKTKEFFGVIDVEFKTLKDAEHFLNNMEINYPVGLITDENRANIESKDILKKMSLLTFQEMKENGKRFGVNDVTKRKNSFNNNKQDLKKFRKNIKKSEDLNEEHDEPTGEVKSEKSEPANDEVKQAKDEAKDESKEPTQDKKDSN